MLTALALDADTLAQHRNAARFGRPVEYRLDSDGSGVAVSLPSPAALAAWLTFPDVDAYRRGSAILTRPHGSNDEPMPAALPDLAATLREILAALPARPDCEAPYRDVRAAARAARSPRFDAYLLGVLRALRSTLPAVPGKPKAPRAAPKSATERWRGHRDRVRIAETASALWWLLPDEDGYPADPGAAITASALYALACEALEDFTGEPLDEDDPDSPPMRVPRRRAFLAAASDVLGTPRRTENGTVYRIPRERPVTLDESLTERATRIVDASTTPATLARVVRRLSDRTLDVLRLSAETLRPGQPLPDFEAEADEIEARIGRPDSLAATDPALAPIADALPLPIVYAVVTAEDDPRRAFGLFARDWLRRHPSDRNAVSDAARAFGPPLVDALRFRAASVLAEGTTA